MSQAEDLLRKLRQRSKKPSDLALLHASLIIGSGSWVPWEEFMEMPMTTIYEVIEGLNYIYEEQNAKVKKPRLR